MRKVQLVTTTATLANKGSDILKTNGIPCEIKKVQGGTAAGCLFGIEVPYNVVDRALEILKASNVRIISKKEV